MWSLNGIYGTFVVMTLDELSLLLFGIIGSLTMMYIGIILHVKENEKKTKQDWVLSLPPEKYYQYMWFINNYETQRKCKHLNIISGTNKDHSYCLDCKKKLNIISGTNKDHSYCLDCKKKLYYKGNIL